MLLPIFVPPLRGLAVSSAYPPFSAHISSPSGWANLWSRLRRLELGYAMIRVNNRLFVVQERQIQSLNLFACQQCAGFFRRTAAHLNYGHQSCADSRILLIVAMDLASLLHGHDHVAD